MDIFVVFTSEDVEHVIGTYRIMEHAIAVAEKEVAKLQVAHPELQFTEDDAAAFVNKVIFSRSAVVDNVEGGGTYVLGVIVQAVTLDW